MVFSSRHWKYRVSTCWKPSQLGGLSGISQPSTPKMFLMKNCWIWSSSLHSFGVQVLDLRSVVSDGDFTMISGKNGLILNKSELMVVHNDESWVNGGFRSNGGTPIAELDGCFHGKSHLNGWFRGTPILGNQQMVSFWTIHGVPHVDMGILYDIVPCLRLAALPWLSAWWETRSHLFKILHGATFATAFVTSGCSHVATNQQTKNIENSPSVWSNTIQSHLE